MVFPKEIFEQTNFNFKHIPNPFLFKFKFLIVFFYKLKRRNKSTKQRIAEYDFGEREL